MQCRLCDIVDKALKFFGNPAVQNYYRYLYI